jgi:hypothetical protein
LPALVTKYTSQILKAKKCKAVPVLGEWRYSSTHLTSAVDRGEWSASLYPQGKSPWYPLDRRLGGPQSRSGRDGGEKNSQPPPGI